MIQYIIIAALFLTSSLVRTNDKYNDNIELRASEFIDKLNNDRCLLENKKMLATWKFRTNMTEENNQIYKNLNSEYIYQEIMDRKEIAKFEWRKFKNESLKRQFMKYGGSGSETFTKENGYDLYKAITQMTTGSTESGVRSAFTEYVNLRNKVSRARNFSNTAEEWLNDYEQDNFEDKMYKLWNQIKPLYAQIYAFIRKKLIDKYGADMIDSRAPLPSNLTAAFFDDEFIPYPNRSSIDVTNIMKQQNYTVMKMIKMAEDFFVSINLTTMNENFWNNSIFEDPNDGRKLFCLPTAWDFFIEEDFRILGCLSVNQLHFQVIHHEMGHIQYFNQYKNQPAIFRSGANPGFHEAIGEVIGLSTLSPQHLKNVGLLEDDVYDDEVEINNLFKKAIRFVGNVPYTLMMDAFRHSVFRGEITEKNYNCRYRTLVEKYQGFVQTTKLSETGIDFGNIEHITTDVEVWRFVVSIVTQFQFHRSLCQKAGQYDPKNSSSKLSNCDIYGSAAAGNSLKAMMSLGSSRPWPEAMELITGQRDMDASALLEYFKPLQLWLEKENAITDEYIGWEKSTVEYCTQLEDRKDENNTNEPNTTDKQKSKVKTVVFSVINRVFKYFEYLKKMLNQIN